MDDLVKSLATGDWYRINADGSLRPSQLPKEAAARIEAQAAMLRECVEALQRAIDWNMADPSEDAIKFADELRACRTTLTRAKEMLG